MEEWRLLDLGALSPCSVHAIYEAIALGVSRGVAPNTVELCYPAEPYVSVGLHQCVELELDLEACQRMGLKIVRRQVGGGVVYLDSGQQFYHVIVSNKHKLADQPVEKFYESVLRAVVEFYRGYGLPAEYKPINDVVVRGRKASGNGAALLYDALVLVGNVILDFDPGPVAKAFKVPSEKFRDKLSSDLREWVTSLKRELGHMPSREEVVGRLARCFEDALGVRLVEGSLTEFEKEKLAGLERALQSPEWLYSVDSSHRELLESFKAHKVKIREGHFVVQVDHKAKKLVRVLAEVVDGRLKDVMVTGDFFAQPVEGVVRLEEFLKGCRLEEREVRGRVSELLRSGGVQLAGVSVDDLVEAFLKVRERIEVL